MSSRNTSVKPYAKKGEANGNGDDAKKGRSATRNGA
ncbi:MAG: hypothetical protein UT06_C0015G0024 [Candidatus Woesebacteria bacterium GW2011_GWA1_38_8]|uniref:Uncharacterized protein n=1 Tax=Candidatus Woesebacteria bacterium GW2011_GWA1_38_8 TaxID=1618547 RepID=A0A0G0ND75_9BACT|nr:MAG: hypothetical protein UT06_C0015G0024 [Candidatus Woesebacteria bacterium GW2011_GWA1_38_8]